MAVSKAGVLRAVENYVDPSLSGVAGAAKSPQSATVKYNLGVELDTMAFAGIV